MHARLLLASSVFVSLSAFGCGLHDEPWTPSTTVSGPSGPVPVGAPTRVVVSRVLEGPTECSPDWLGGGQTCERDTRDVPLRALSVTCTGGTCTTEQVGADVVVHVDAESAGLVVGTVLVEGDGGDREPIAFEAELVDAPVVVTRPLVATLQGTTYAHLAGTDVLWEARLGVPSSNVTYDPRQLSLSVAGASSEVVPYPPTLVDPRHPRLERIDRIVMPSSAGTVEITYRYGRLARTETLRVVDMGDVVSVALAELPTGDVLGSMPIETDALAGAPHVDAARLGSCASRSFAPVLRTAQGDAALGATRALRAEPDDLVKLWATSDEVLQVTPRRRGEGRLVGTGALSWVSIPLVVDCDAP